MVLVGDDERARSMLGAKKSIAQTGIKSQTFRLAAKSTEAEVIKLVKDLNQDTSVDDILVQLPLPKHIDTDKVIQSISLKESRRSYSYQPR